jgi:subtilisin family serine protease
MRLATFLLACGLPLLAPVAAAVAAPAARPPVTPLAVRKYLVYFRDKAASPYSVSQPQAFLSARSVQRRTKQGIAVKPRDLPVNPAYVAQVRAVPGVQVWYTSRWLNAAVVMCDASVLPTVLALPCVRTSGALNRPATQPSPVKLEPEEPASTSLNRLSGTPADYGSAFGQVDMLGAVAMHDAGYRGEGMQIAVFDAGFPGVNTTAPFASLMADNRVASTFNFVDKSPNVYLRDGHGTNCLSTMAANQTGTFIGTAPKATYRLCITEDTGSENPIEEANWLLAAEYADSCGVDVISSSLGYTTFDNPTLSHTYADMNGRNTIATKAATVAARVGMLVVNAAGNDGNGAWRYIGAPADADSIISVAAVSAALTRASFSSYGTTADGRIKPDLAAQGASAAIVSTSGTPVRGNGTSFACPILAGMAAGFWQANPGLTAQQVISYLKQSATQAKAPDNSLGWGIPNFAKANELANPFVPLTELSIYPNPLADGQDLLLNVPTDLRNIPLTVRVYDMRGALVAEQQLTTSSPTAVLPAGRLRPGIYLCRVQWGNEAPRTLRLARQ